MSSGLNGNLVQLPKEKRTYNKVLGDSYGRNLLVKYLRFEDLVMCFNQTIGHRVIRTSTTIIHFQVMMEFLK